MEYIYFKLNWLVEIHKCVELISTNPHTIPLLPNYLFIYFKLTLNSIEFQSEYNYNSNNFRYANDLYFDQNFKLFGIHYVRTPSSHFLYLFCSVLVSVHHLSIHLTACLHSYRTWIYHLRWWDDDVYAI